MSIATEVTRIVNAKTALRTAINAKGGTIAAADKLGTYAAQVDALEPAEFGNRVRFFDYDGTLLKTMYVASGEDAVPPSNPAHTGLTFSAWNVPYENVTGDVDVGAVFVPTSGKTEIDIRELIDEKNYTLNFEITSGTLSIDWGDGSDAETVTATGTKAHTFMTRGSYTIKITASSGAVWKPGSYFCNGGSSDWETATQAVRFAGITEIKDNALYRARSLRSVVIPGTVTTIGSSAFRYCYALQAVVLPDSVTSIGSSAFQYCYCLNRVLLGDGCATIPVSCFEYDYALCDMVIPSGITTINSEAFYECRAIKEIYLPDTVATLGDSSFAYCRSLRELHLPSAVTAIPVYCFKECLTLRSINIPPNVTEIRRYAFSCCYAVESITLPSGLLTIRYQAFEYCMAVKSLTIPETVTTVEYNAFYQTGLRKITIPAALQTIGSSAFWTYGMLDVKMMATTVPTIDDSSVFGDNGNRRIEVPAASLTAYKGATNWSSMADNIFAAE